MFQNKRNDNLSVETVVRPNNTFVRLINGVKRFVAKNKILSVLLVAVVLYLTWFLISKTAGEIASLSLNPTSATVTAGTNFNVAINIDTKGNNIVAVKSVLNYNPADFQIVSWNTSSSAFSSGNTCVYNNKPCEIITENPQTGSIIITLAKPSPGVNTPSGLIANLTLKPLRALSPSANNLTLHYTAFGNYTDSDVILDDKLGTDILSSVTNSKVTAVLPVPTGLTGSGKSATETSLTWNNPIVSVGISGYKIFRNNIQVGSSTTNSYTDTGLKPLTSYSYSISAYDSSGNESGKTSAINVSTLADTSAPTVPAGLAASDITMNQIKLTWTASTDNVGVTAYNIYRDGSKIGTTDATTFTNTGLAPEKIYAYRVSALDAAGNESAQSTEIKPKTSADSEAPTVPTNLNVQAVSISEIQLTWTASNDNVAVTGYTIYRNGTKIGTSTSASYKDTGLSSATAYSYKVSAYDAKGNESAQSASASATTNADTTAPTVPAGLTANAASMTSVNLNWSASTDNVKVVSYNVFRDGTQIGNTATTTYSDTGLTKGTAYSYTVSALDAAGNQSAQSTSAAVTTPNDTEKPTAPTNLLATAVSMTQINLSWNASTDNLGVTGYNVYRNGAKVGTVTTGLTYEDTGLAQNTSYSYTVTALDGDGNESTHSNTATTNTLAKTYGLADFAALVTDWLQTKSSPADVDGDGKVNSKDLGIMMSNWQ